MHTGITRSQGHPVVKVTMMPPELSGMPITATTTVVAMVMDMIRAMSKVSFLRISFETVFIFIFNELWFYVRKNAFSFVLEVTPSRMTPVKHSIPHTSIRFGPGGHLVKVIPNRPAEGQPAIVEIHDLNEMLQDNPETEELKNFPGPLVR